MTGLSENEAPMADVLAVYQLYGRQSHAIDSGQAEEWAATFTADGEFNSPSYPAPSHGRAELVEFAARFHAGCRERNERLRHVISTVEVLSAGSGSLHCRAYLQIVGTAAGEPPRLHRITVLDDELVRVSDKWLVRRRNVNPDA